MDKVNAGCCRARADMNAIMFIFLLIYVSVRCHSRAECSVTPIFGLERACYVEGDNPSSDSFIKREPLLISGTMWKP